MRRTPAVGLWLPSDDPDAADELVAGALDDLEAGLAGEEGRHAAARDALMRALNLVAGGDPRFPWVLFHLAWVYLTWPDPAEHRQAVELAVQFAEAAADAVPDDPADHEPILEIAVSARWRRYALTEDRANLLAAARLVDRLPPVSPDNTALARVFADVHLGRYKETSDAKDLSAAETIARSVLGPVRTVAIGFEELDLCSDVLAGVYEARPVPDLLVEAIRWSERALLFADASPQRSWGLQRLADRQRVLWGTNGDPACLDRAVEAASEAARLEPGSASARLALGRVLRARYQARSDLDDLNEAIGLLREAVGPGLTVQRHAELGTALRLRYEALGSSQDLSEVVQLAEADVDGVAPGPLALAQYADTLRLAFERTGDASTLEKTIEAGRRAVAGTRPGESGADVARNALATGLLKMAGSGRPELLDEAITALDEAFGAASPSAPNTAAIQINRATAYRMRWEAGGSRDALETAHAAAGEVVDGTSLDHPLRAARLRTLATILDAVSRTDDDPEARAAALSARDEAAASVAASPESRIRAAVTAGLSLAEQKRWKEADARFAVAVSLLPEVAWHGLDRSSQEERLAEGTDLPALAAAHAVQAGDTVGAVTRLEVGRSVMWQHLLRVTGKGSPGVVTELRRAVEAERLFREWLQSEDAGASMPREQVTGLASELGELGEPGAAAVVLGTLGQQLRRAGEVPAAIASYRDAIAYGEAAGDSLNLAVLHGNLGFAYRQSGEAELGIEHYRRSVAALKPSAASNVVGNARNNLGIALFKAGHHAEAAKELSAAASSFAAAGSPRQAVALHDLAVALTQTGQLDDALSVVRRAQKLATDGKVQRHAWYTEGVVHYHAGRMKQAIECLERSLALYDHDDPERSEIEAVLAMARQG
jgi:tetratricopeptide (TPR) repeat protein